MSECRVNLPNRGLTAHWVLLRVVLYSTTTIPVLESSRMISNRAEQPAKNPGGREIPRENSTVSFILTVDLSMRAECMHEK